MLFEATGLPTLKKSGSSFRSHQRPMPIGNFTEDFHAHLFPKSDNLQKHCDWVIGNSMTGNANR
jgi:hypothetical protein